MRDLLCWSDKLLDCLPSYAVLISLYTVLQASWQPSMHTSEAHTNLEETRLVPVGFRHMHAGLQMASSTV